MSEGCKTNIASPRKMLTADRLDYVLKTPPEIGVPAPVASGIWILRLLYEGTMDHVNAYILHDDEGLVLIDTGPRTGSCLDAINHALTHPAFSGRKVQRVLATHFHPDHIGLVGELCDHGAKLITSRTCWLAANLLQTTDLQSPRQAHIDFMVRAGFHGHELEAFRRRIPSSYPQQVAPLPQTYQSIDDGTHLTIGDRNWQVRFLQGHCPDQITLWSDDGIAVVADQILPNVSPSLAVHYSDPLADHVSEWLASCRRLATIADSQTLCLPGHGVPFRGAPLRCRQLIESCVSVLDRLLKALSKPLTVLDCLKVIYRRQLHPSERMILIGVVVAYLNHLQRRGLVVSRPARNGVLLWRRCSSMTSYEWNEYGI